MMLYLLNSFFLLIFYSSLAHAKIQCNSSVPGENGQCTGDYCFNIEDQYRGCIDFYRMIRDDNIACGQIPFVDGTFRKFCICTQPYCSKYSVDNMPMQTLADVKCYKDPNYLCSPGPCYVGNDLTKMGFHQRDCMQDWFAVMNFKQLIIYEVPPLAGHPACFFDGNQFNCMCKDLNCNYNLNPVKEPVTLPDNAYFTCHKTKCEMGTIVMGMIVMDKDCDERSLGNDTCIGQMCYFSKFQYKIRFDGHTYQQNIIVRDCLNYSFENPIDDLTFATGLQFGKNSYQFSPCIGNYCNGKSGNQITSTATAASISVVLLLIVYSAMQFS